MSTAPQVSLVIAMR